MANRKSTRTRRVLKMPDHSDLDNRYFIDEHVYNCPFCNRRNVAYEIDTWALFDWTADKRCYLYVVKCSSCRNRSMHLSFREIELQHFANDQRGNKRYRFKISDGEDLDACFFYSVPTSFFVLDERIPQILRKLMTEAEGCLKSNFLTGASACARKMIYELSSLQGGEGNNYEDRLKSLKTKLPDVDPTFFDTLLSIQQATSSGVHEQSYDGWKAGHLRLILLTLA
jgi:hypothetical protein